MNMNELDFFLAVDIEKPRPFGICNEPEQVKLGTQNHQNLPKFWTFPKFDLDHLIER